MGAGGYLGGCMYGYLQRAAALYETGIAGAGSRGGSSPRCITATAFGSQNLNSLLGKHFILAQADESFVKLTNLACTESITHKLQGMDAVLLATRYLTETRPVTGNTYETTPNDKTKEVYMDQPRSSTIIGEDNPQYCWDLFQRSLQACRAAGVQRIVVVETDIAMQAQSVVDRTQYIKVLQEAKIPFVYIQPVASMLQNCPDYTYAKGIQGDIQISVLPAPDDNDRNSSSTKISESNNDPLYREDLAAVCVQSLLSLDWTCNYILAVSSNGNLISPTKDGGNSAVTGTGTTRPRPTSTIPLHKQWCVHSDVLAATLNAL
jgi:hypothetical protein